MKFRISAKVYLLSILLATAFGGLVLPALAQNEASLVQGPFTPEQIYVFNNNSVAYASTTSVTVASLTYTASGSHHLVIQFSAVGSVQPQTWVGDCVNILQAYPGSKNVCAVMYLGCFVDGVPCLGSEIQPPRVPSGWVNTLSTNFASQTAWTNACGYTWFTKNLETGTHTIVILAETGNALFGFGGQGTVYVQARNLIVTITT